MTLASKFDWPTDELVYAIRDNKILVGKWDFTQDKITSLVTSEIDSGFKITIHYKKKGTKFTISPVASVDLSETPSYPNQFHDGIMYRVLEQLHAQRGNPKTALYYKAEYKECVMMAKRFKNQGRDGSNYAIRQHPM